jgi:hypothetical protein
LKKVRKVSYFKCLLVISWKSFIREYCFRDSFKLKEFLQYIVLDLGERWFWHDQHWRWRNSKTF